MRLLTLEDVEDIQVDPNWSPLDMLGAVCERASEIHEKEEIKKIHLQENSPSRMSEFAKRSHTRKEDRNLKDGFFIKNRDTAIVDANSTKVIMTNAERREFKKRLMGFDMNGFTCWKRNNTTDVLTGYKKQSGLISEENVRSEERLRREKKLKRSIDEVERRISPSSGLNRKRSLSDDDQVVPKKRNVIKFKRTESETEHAELELPENVKNRINALGKQVKKLKLIIEKTVYKTDASESHNRLSIPAAQVSREKFLNDEEEEYLCMRNGKKVNSKKVRVIDPSLNIGELELRRWEMKKVRKNLKQKEESKMSVSYVLNGKWTEMRIHNNIKEGNKIQLWAVRMDDGELIIVLVKLPDDEEEEEEEVTVEEEEVDIEEQEGGDGADSKTNVATTSKQHQD
ncbi:hypothetical protein HAX54_052619 [Datura stramonium]|uniref:TF-B3 domain-containing protein n=1 Tax=Datura stramonium TaxID=4076 RepID=A0ABS8SZV5_DATST|nr:hypothetical protein [Datura stramonium]